MLTIEALRAIRLGPFAVFDFAMTYLVVFFIGPHLRKVGIPISREQAMYLALPISVVTHLAFGVDTPLTRMVLDSQGYFIWKGIIISMIILAVVRRKVRI